MFIKQNDYVPGVVIHNGGTEVTQSHSTSWEDFHLLISICSLSIYCLSHPSDFFPHLPPETVLVNLTDWLSEGGLVIKVNNTYEPWAFVVFCKQALLPYLTMLATPVSELPASLVSVSVPQSPQLFLADHLLGSFPKPRTPPWSSFPFMALCWTESWSRREQELLRPSSAVQFWESFSDAFRQFFPPSQW